LLQERPRRWHQARKNCWKGECWEEARLSEGKREEGLLRRKKKRVKRTLIREDAECRQLGQKMHKGEGTVKAFLGKIITNNFPAFRRNEGGATGPTRQERTKSDRERGSARKGLGKNE